MKGLLLILFLIPTVYGWGCVTHQYICQEAGMDHLNCCSADTRKIKSNYPYTSSYYHHCEANDEDCRARKTAQIYLQNNDKVSNEIQFHMLADSMTPVHWISTNYYECHKPFEDLVNRKIGDTDWKITYDCKLKNGSVFRIMMDKKYLDHVAEYSLNYTQNITAHKNSDYLQIKDCSDGCKSRFLIELLNKIKEIIGLIF